MSSPIGAELQGQQSVHNLAQTKTNEQQLTHHTALQANPSACKAGGNKAASSSTKGPGHMKCSNIGKVLGKRYAQYKKKARSTTNKGSKAARASSVKLTCEQATARQSMAHVHRIAESPQSNIAPKYNRWRRHAKKDQRAKFRDGSVTSWITTQPRKQAQAMMTGAAEGRSHRIGGEEQHQSRAAVTVPLVFERDISGYKQSQRRKSSTLQVSRICNKVLGCKWEGAI